MIRATYDPNVDDTPLHPSPTATSMTKRKVTQTQDSEEDDYDDIDAAHLPPALDKYYIDDKKEDDRDTR